MLPTLYAAGLNRSAPQAFTAWRMLKAKIERAASAFTGLSTRVRNLSPWRWRAGLGVEGVDQRTSWFLPCIASSDGVGENPLHPLEIGDPRSNVLQMNGGQVAYLCAGGVSASRQAKQRPHLIECEAEFAGAAHKSEPDHIPSAVTAVAASPRRCGHQTDPLVVADRLDVAARAPGQFANRDRGIRHAVLRLSILGLSL